MIVQAISDQILFSAIVKISSLSNTTKLPLIEEKCKSNAVEATNIFENISKYIEVNNPYLLALTTKVSQVSNATSTLMSRKWNFVSLT